MPESKIPRDTSYRNLRYEPIGGRFWGTIQRVTLADYCFICLFSSSFPLLRHHVHFICMGNWKRYRPRGIAHTGNNCVRDRVWTLFQYALRGDHSRGGSAAWNRPTKHYGLEGRRISQTRRPSLGRFLMNRMNGREQARYLTKSGSSSTTVPDIVLSYLGIGWNMLLDLIKFGSAAISAA